MLYEIIFCFFTAFGIVQILEIIKEFCWSKVREDVTMIVGVNENTGVEALNKELSHTGAKLVFVYSGISSEKLEVLRRKYEYASFVERETLSEDVLKLI